MKNKYKMRAISAANVLAKCSTHLKNYDNELRSNYKIRAIIATKNYLLRKNKSYVKKYELNANIK